MLPEIYLSVYAGQDVETVPSTSDIASSILRDSLVDTIKAIAMPLRNSYCSQNDTSAPMSIFVIISCSVVLRGKPTMDLEAVKPHRNVANITFP